MTDKNKRFPFKGANYFNILLPNECNNTKKREKKPERSDHKMTNESVVNNVK